MTSQDEAIAHLIQHGLGKPQTRRYCTTCMEYVGKCAREKRCKAPNWVTQSRYTFETPWVTIHTPTA